MKGKGAKPTMNRWDKENYSDEWYTPPSLVRSLGEFDLDPCAAAKNIDLNHARVNFRGPDGLVSAWQGRVWLNRPYSQVRPWMERMRSHGNGIALVNAWTERDWFQAALSQASAVLLLKGRVSFLSGIGREKPRAMVGSALIAFGKANAQALASSGLKGTIIRAES